MKDKIYWVMFWWAIGDAMWAPYEWMEKGTFSWVNEYSRFHWFNKGEWTDDTAMNLMLWKSLLECWGNNPEHQLDLYLERAKTWKYWLRPRARWIGIQTSEMIFDYEYYKQSKFEMPKPWEEDYSWSYKDWNGSLMRIGVVPLYYFNQWLKAVIEWASLSSITTHNTKDCRWCCSAMAYFIYKVMKGCDKETLFNLKIGWWSKAVQKIVNKEFKKKKHYELKPKWYVVDSLECALRCFYHSITFDDWLELAVNLWWDADTIACIYWYLWWAYYWYDWIPKKLIDWLLGKDKILEVADWLVLNFNNK